MVPPLGDLLQQTIIGYGLQEILWPSTDSPGATVQLSAPRRVVILRGWHSETIAFYFSSFALCGCKDDDLPGLFEEEEEDEETEFQKAESIDRASGMELGVRGTGGHSPGGRGLLAQTKISLCFLLM